jgi:hypothetical protein
MFIQGGEKSGVIWVSRGSLRFDSQSKGIGI